MFSKKLPTSIRSHVDSFNLVLFVLSRHSVMPRQLFHPIRPPPPWVTNAKLTAEWFNFLEHIPATSFDMRNRIIHRSLRNWYPETSLISFIQEKFHTMNSYPTTSAKRNTQNLTYTNRQSEDSVNSPSVTPCSLFTQNCIVVPLQFRTATIQLMQE